MINLSITVVSDTMPLTRYIAKAYSSKDNSTIYFKGNIFSIVDDIVLLFRLNNEVISDQVEDLLLALQEKEIRKRLGKVRLEAKAITKKQA